MGFLNWKLWSCQKDQRVEAWQSSLQILHLEFDLSWALSRKDNNGGKLVGFLSAPSRCLDGWFLLESRGLVENPNRSPLQLDSLAVSIRKAW